MGHHPHRPQSSFTIQMSFQNLYATSDFSKMLIGFGARMARMTTFAKNNSKSTVIPGLRYRDAMKAIDWLCKCMGFEKQAVYPGADGKVMHAQLTFGNGMIMLGSVDNGTPSSRLTKQPDEIQGAETQSPYLVVSNIEEMYASVQAGGAKITMPLEEKEYGGKGFTCADPEGHIWHVGTYDPWARL